MNRYRLKISTAALMPSVATMLFVRACGGGGDAVGQQAADPFEGVWQAVVTARDGTSGATLGTFRGAQVVHRSDTHASPPATRGPGDNADGTLAGTTVVTSKRTLGSDGNSYTCDTHSEVRDIAGAVVSQTCVADVGTRFG